MTDLNLTRVPSTSKVSISKDSLPDKTSKTRGSNSSIPGFLRGKRSGSVDRLCAFSSRIPACSCFNILKNPPPKPADVGKVVLVGNPPPMTAILNGETEAPFDIGSLLHHCNKTLTRELPDFYLAVEAFKNCTNNDHYQDEVEYLISEFIEASSPRQINIDVGLRKRVEEKAAECIESEIHDRCIFGEVQEDIYKLLNSDVRTKFFSHLTLQRNLYLARQQALWFRHLPTLTLKEFFSFPNPINEVDSRCHNILSLIWVLLGCFLHGFDYDWGKWILVYVLYGFVARTLCGPRIDPQAFLVLFVVSPIVTRILNITPKFTASPPKRFAQLCGVMFSVIGLTLIFTENRIPAYAVYGVLGFCAFLAGAFGYCVACQMLVIGVKLGWVPPDICDDCTVEYCATDSVLRKSISKDSGHESSGHERSRTSTAVTA